MHLSWLVPPLVAVLCCVEAGSSLRGAVEALQRRQRSNARGPVIPASDYDALYEFVPPGYPDPEYPIDMGDIQADTPPKYIVKLLDDENRSPDTYEYKIIKKKNSRLENNPVQRNESPFRERSHHADNDKLKDLFTDKNEHEDKNELSPDKNENDAEYALLLGELWSKYRNNNPHAKISEGAPHGVVKLYKEKVVKKRYPNNWGPIAFKRKRSSDSDTDRPVVTDYEEKKQIGTPESNYNTYEVSDPDNDKDDWHEEYAIAFQPLDDDTLSDLTEDEQYSYDVEKRFPVTKRSSGLSDFSNHKKRFALNKKFDKTKAFRSSSGTDPRIIKDLSKIFGGAEIEIIKTPVKRDTQHEENHETKPPNLTVVHQNHTNDPNNSSKIDEDSNEHISHNIHHPGLTGMKEVKPDIHIHGATAKPKIVRKKSIDWSDYFGIDKRSKKFVTDLNQDRLRKQYFDTFNKEVIFPSGEFQKHNFVKRNYVKPKPDEEDSLDRSSHSEKQTPKGEGNSKLDSIDNKLKTMEGIIVDEALHYSNSADEVDTKEEQEMKEKLVSRLAAAYSLEKMRKALKEFKQTLQKTPLDEAKVKRVAVKKEKVERNQIPFLKPEQQLDDFEEEQGAGHYLNGKVEPVYSEGYMGGSGRHRTPVMATVGSGSCPVLERIVQRCRGVDLLAGDRGQLFLPLCSLHQICYLCGETPPTTCDLVFLSEADTSCDGDMGCQRAARSALMALRELHDTLADEMDGECEASPCLTATLKLNDGWQRAIQR